MNNQGQQFFSARWFQIGVLAALAAALIVGASFWFATGVRADTPNSVVPSPLGSSLTAPQGFVLAAAASSASLAAPVDYATLDDSLGLTSATLSTVDYATLDGSLGLTSATLSTVDYATLDDSLGVTSATSSTVDYATLDDSLGLTSPRLSTVDYASLDDSLGLTSAGSSAAASPLPLGTYVNDKAPWGAEVLNLAGGGQCTENVGGLFDVTCTWKATGDQFQVTQTSDPADCNGAQGTYKWALDGNTLTLTLVQDQCGPRSGQYASGPLTRQP